MKYLFVVQGEGRGHLTQAISLAQILRRNGHEVVEVLVGKGSNRELPSFFSDKMGCRIRKFDSPALDYGKKGKRGNIIKSILLNTTPKKLAKWRKSMDIINRRISKTKPDVVINFYEILVGLTSLVHHINVPIISIAHQFVVDHPDYTHHSKSNQKQFLLRLNNMLCSFGTTKTIVLSFYEMKDSYRNRMAVLPPLLRQEVLESKSYDGKYILGYILNPAYLNEIKSWHEKCSEYDVHLFWDKKGAPECLEVHKGLTVHRINDTKFIKLMEGCSGYATTAGFESVCEAMYLGKPTMMIPAHIEQEINAIDAETAGAGIVSSEFNISALIEYMPDYEFDVAKFRDWVNSADDLFIRHLTTFI